MSTKKRICCGILALILVALMLPITATNAATDSGYAAALKKMFYTYGQVGQRVEFASSHYAMLMGWDENGIIVMDANGGVNSISQRNQVRKGAVYSYDFLSNYAQITLVANPSLSSYSSGTILLYYDRIYEQLLNWKEYKTGSRTGTPFLTTTGTSCQCANSACNACNIIYVMPELEKAEGLGVLTLGKALERRHTCWSCYAFCWFVNSYIFGNDNTNKVYRLDRSTYKTDPIMGTASGDPSPAINASEYLANYATVTPISATAVTKNNASYQTWKLPWTNNKDASLKLKTVSGKIKIINKIINHAGNTWYEYETGTSTRGFIYSSDITIEPYFAKHTCTGVTADNAKFAHDLMNPSKYTIKTAGFYYGTKPDPVNTGSKITDTVVSSYQTAASIPCTHNLKDEYSIALNSGTTYYYVLYCTDSSGKYYYSDEYSFTTSSISVTSVAISPGNSSLNIGKTLQLSAVVSPSNATNKGVNWSSSDTSVATVSSSGLVTAKAKGSATITATAKDGSGKKASITVTVSCAHNSGYNIDAYVAPTCTKTGLTEGKRCKVCNEVITAQTTIPATGHSEVTDKGAAATCTATGLTDGKHCSVCGTVTVKQTTIPAKGHTEVTDRGYAATCTQDGLTDGKHCSVCGTVTVKQTIIPAPGHDRNEWGTCTRCEDFYGTGKCGDNLTYEIVVGDDGLVLTISGTGEMYDYEHEDTPWYGFAIVRVVIEEGVTNVSSYAFNCAGISTVTLPDSLLRIGSMAFGNNRELRYVHIPKNVSKMDGQPFLGCSGLKEYSVDPENMYYSNDEHGVLFNKDKTILVDAPDSLEGEYVIPGTVERITAGAFIRCEDITSVYIPGSVTFLGGQAFDWATELKEIKFGGNAPEFYQYSNTFFQDVTATVYYPSGNPTWTDDVKRDYGGNLTWVPYLDKLSNVTINKVNPHTTGNIIYWDAVECADIYQIYRLRSGETSWTLLKNTRSLGYKDETAVAGLKYYYKIVARNGDVKSDIRTTSSVGMVRPGAAVTRLGNVTVYKTIGHSTGNILYWNAVENAKIYQVYRLEGGQWVLLKNTGSLGYKDETAPVGVKCYYKIVARNGDVKSDIKTTASASAKRP